MYVEPFKGDIVFHQRSAYYHKEEKTMGTLMAAETKQRVRKRMICALLSLVLISTLSGVFPSQAHATVTDYDTMRAQVGVLEGYAANWIEQSGYTAGYSSAAELSAAYIRTARYNSSSWRQAVGPSPDAFIEYCEAQDTLNHTDVQSLRTMGNIVLPNGDITDAVHMFATINGSQAGGWSTDLTGLFGDICDLLLDTYTNTGDEDTLYAAAKAAFNGLGGSCGSADVTADLDAYNLAIMSKTTSLSSAMDSYFTPSLTNEERVSLYCADHFAGVDTNQAAYRAAVSDTYKENFLIQYLEATRHISGSAFDAQRTACLNVVADYLLENYTPATPTVTSVTVSPRTATLNQGDTQTFTAQVLGTNNPAQGVTWTVSGATDSATAIAADGTLTVGAAETSTALTVTATSTADPSKSGTASVEVIVPVAKQTPTLTPPSASAITYGQSLSDSTLSGGTAMVGTTVVPGTFTWSAPATAPAAADSNTTAYEVTFTPDDTSAYSIAMTTTTLVVNKAVPNYSLPSGLTATEGDTLGDVSLPAGFSWESPATTPVGSAGVNSFTATFIPSDTANFETVTGISLDITVSSAPSTVTSVTVSPNTAKLNQGDTQTFTAQVLGTNNPAQGVTWTVSGATDSSTAIAADGTLTVGAAEISTALTVTATSTVDPSKSGTAAIEVLIPVVDGVKVTPPAVTLDKGDTQQFTAIVTVSPGGLNDVTWSVSGNNSALTTIDNAGLLSVAANESSAALTVTACSKTDPTKYGTASVVVTQSSVKDLHVNPSTATLQAGRGMQLDYVINYIGNATDLDLSITWGLTGNSSSDTTIDANGNIAIASDETATTVIVTATSNEDPTKIGTATIIITPAPAISSIVLTAPTNPVAAGQSVKITADVTAQGGADTSFTWSVSGATSAETTIDAEGNLTVGADETATSLTITATSTFDPSKTETVSVAVTPKDSTDNISNENDGTDEGNTGETGSAADDNEGTTAPIAANQSTSTVAKEVVPRLSAGTPKTSDFSTSLFVSSFGLLLLAGGTLALSVSRCKEN